MLPASSSVFSSTLRPPPRSSLFPYTTLFRSLAIGGGVRIDGDTMRKIADLALGEADVVPRIGLEEIDARAAEDIVPRSEEHTSELQSLAYLVCRLLLEKKKQISCSTQTATRP